MIAGIFKFFLLIRRRNGKHIMFASGNYPDLNGNLKAIYDRMCERGLDHQFSLHVDCGVPYGIALRLQPKLIQFIFHIAKCNYISVSYTHLVNIYILKSVLSGSRNGAKASLHLM